jgi:hypothetical protein
MTQKVRAEQLDTNAVTAKVRVAPVPLDYLFQQLDTNAATGMATLTCKASPLCILYRLRIYKSLLRRKYQAYTCRVR